MGTNGGRCCAAQFSDMRPPHPNYSRGSVFSVPGLHLVYSVVFVPEYAPLLTVPTPVPSRPLFSPGRPDVVESVPDNPTYTVSSEITLEVSRSDNNAHITCVVDHASLAPGNKTSEQALRVLCESIGEHRGVGKWGGERQRMLVGRQGTQGEIFNCFVYLFSLLHRCSLSSGCIGTHPPLLQSDLCFSNFT